MQFNTAYPAYSRCPSLPPYLTPHSGEVNIAVSALCSEEAKKSEPRIIKFLEDSTPSQILEVAKTITCLSWGKLNIESQEESEKIEPETVAKMIWVFLKNQTSIKTAFCAAATRGLKKYDISELVSIARSLDDLNYRDAELSRKLKDFIVASFLSKKKLSTQDIVWSAFAFRKEHLNIGFYTLLKDASKKNLKEFSVEELGILAKAFTQANFKDAQFWKNIDCIVCKKKENLSPEDAVNLIWSYSYLAWRNRWNPSWNPSDTRNRHLTLISDLKDVFLRPDVQLNAEQLSKTAWAFKHLNFIDDELFEKISNLSVSSFVDKDDFTFAELITITKSLTGTRKIGEEVLKELILKIEQKVEEKDPSIKPALLSQVAYAVLTKYCKSDDYQGFIEKMLDAIMETSAHEWTGDELSQIHTTYCIYMKKNKVEEFMPESLRKRIEQYQNDRKRQRPSLFHEKVIAYLRRQNFRFLVEFRFGSFDIDIAFLKDKLAIEVDGPCHFDHHGRYLEEHIVKEFLLEHEGWRLCRIKSEELMKEQLDEFLKIK